MSEKSEYRPSGLEGFDSVKEPIDEADRRPSGPYGEWPEEVSTPDTTDRRPSGPYGEWPEEVSTPDTIDRRASGPYGEWPTDTPMTKLFNKYTYVNPYAPKIGNGMPSMAANKPILIMILFAALMIALVVMVVLYIQDHKQLKQLQQHQVVPAAVS